MRRRLRNLAVAVLSCGLSCAPVSGQCAIGDIDLDGFVGITDFLAVLGQWGPCPDPPTACPTDLDGDGATGIEDFLAILGHWGPTDVAGGGFPGQWPGGGPACPNGPDIEVHKYNDSTYILRQSLCTHYEGPFIYLFFGQDKVLMQDTGVTSVGLADKVYEIIDHWLFVNALESIELVVSHSHSHTDHFAGDSEFTGQPNTTVVGLSVAQVAGFFGITNWPQQIVEYDLGERVIDVIAIPGHQTAHIALWDRDTGLLLTGDSLYPGRLYIFDFPAYMQSIQRLLDFTADKDVCHVLGTHIEMSNTPGVDFPLGSTSHPDEHPLQLGREHLIELLAGLQGMQKNPQIEVHDEFIIWPF